MGPATRGARAKLQYSRALQRLARHSNLAVCEQSEQTLNILRT